MTETRHHADAPADPAPAELGLREQKKRQTRLDMHQAAIELVAEHGLSAVTAQMIAQRAGVSTRTFFNHWSTKEAAILGVIGDEGPRAVASLREKIGVMGARQALHAVMRDGIANVPVDPELRELKKKVMAKEPSLQSISSGNLQHMQAELVDVLAEALDGEYARDHAVILVQVAFALMRSAFAISMRRGIDLVRAFDQVVALYERDDLDI
ncbi:TetR/AcrR family transcriptional regulator [Brachybacterium sp. NBEC-018]|uniref:TetR/AcrR family transcriptional regulator n=1 Tax=Brachybacterium sp. NBEC-018 TaxID=2996004 RepID=UPI0021751355|nr:TetR/AcrR family transcriptional regulator [Brachybacterium sp. NBEC-018]UVY83657.1 TetR/AcrR family transcriptional regulator [Brachybacterium sp. NBEC-018]